MLDVFFIVAGLIGLVWSSDKFVDGAAAIASLAGLSPLLIGLTIVSLGTSAPEIVISVIASLSGSGELAVGNALGSNITNTGLVLGITLIIKAISVEAATTRRELPQMLGATLLAGALMIDGDLSMLDGLVLLSALRLVSLLALRDRRLSGLLELTDLVSLQVAPRAGPECLCELKAREAYPPEPQDRVPDLF